MKKVMLFFILLALLSMSVLAVNLGIVEKFSPSLKLNFSSESDLVTIVNYNLTLAGHVVNYFNSPVTVSRNVFVFSPQLGFNLSDNGNYNFKVSYRDDAVPPNYNLSQYSFTLQYPGLNITIVEPTFGVSNSSPYTLHIHTDRNSECRYSTISQKSYGAMTQLFTRINSTDYNKSSFTHVGTLYLSCNDLVYGGETNTSFALSVDGNPPLVTLAAADILEETSPGNYSTTLIATTNKDTVCRYSNESVDYGDMLPFPDYDESHEPYYQTYHEQVLDQDYLINGQVNTIYVDCLAKSGLYSDRESIDITVNTNSTPSITIHSPPRYIQDTTPLFNVSTNRDAVCTLYNGTVGGAHTQTWSMTKSGNTYRRTLTTALTPRTYTYYVGCLFEVDQQPSPVPILFTLDISAPNMAYANITDFNNTGKVWQTDRLCAEWSAEDPQSSISTYEYFVYHEISGNDEVIEHDATTSEDECIDVELNNSNTYYLQVRAQNIVGLWSQNKTSNKVIVDTSLRPVSCSNDRQDGSETDIDCGGSCGPCGTGMNCTLNSDCISGLCNATDVCQAPSCDDNIKNQDETDIDCGGSRCEKCDEGDSCEVDRDCESGDCDVSSDTCEAVADSCRNNIQDIGETDVDCGGQRCPSCSPPQRCLTSADCVPSAECVAGQCTIRSLDNDGDGIPNNQDNCPNNANADQKDTDGDGFGDACDADIDNDGMPNSCEQTYFDCPTCADATLDSDGDGLGNREECQQGTNPTKADTDGDSFDDKVEIEAGTDPLDPSSRPGSSFFMWFWILLLLLLIIGLLLYFILFKPFNKKEKRIEKTTIMLPPRQPPRQALPRMQAPMQPAPPVRPVMQQKLPSPAPAVQPPKKVHHKVRRSAFAKLKQITGSKKREKTFQQLAELIKNRTEESTKKKIEKIKEQNKKIKEQISDLKKKK